MIPFWLAVFKRPAGRLLWPGLAAYYGPDWPGIMALLAGENGYMHQRSPILHMSKSKNGVQYQQRYVNAPVVRDGVLFSP